MVIQDHTGKTTITIQPTSTLLARKDHVQQELEDTNLAACTRRGNT